MGWELGAGLVAGMPEMGPGLGRGCRLLDDLEPDASRRSACLAGLRGWGTSDRLSSWRGLRPVSDTLARWAEPAGGLGAGGRPSGPGLACWMWA